MNQFVAQFGLNKAQVVNDIQNQRMDRILPMLDLYTRTMESLRSGYTFHDPELTDWLQDLRKNYLDTQDIWDDPDSPNPGGDGGGGETGGGRSENNPGNTNPTNFDKQREWCERQPGHRWHDQGNGRGICLRPT